MIIPSNSVRKQILKIPGIAEMRLLALPPVKKKLRTETETIAMRRRKANHRSRPKQKLQNLTPNSDYEPDPSLLTMNYEAWLCDQDDKLLILYHIAIQIFKSSAIQINSYFYL